MLRPSPPPAIPEEELLEGQEPPEDVLRKIGPVHAEDQAGSAHRSEWNPTTSAPSCPDRSSMRIAAGSVRKYPGPANGMWEKCAIRAFGLRARSNAGTSDR